MKASHAVVALGAVALGGYLIVAPKIQDNPQQQTVPHATSAEPEGATPQQDHPGTGLLECGAPYAKQLILNVIGKKWPAKLIDEADGNTVGKLNEQFAPLLACRQDYQNTMAQLRGNPEADPTGTIAADADHQEDECQQKAAEQFGQIVKPIEKQTAFALKNVRLESRDPTTGAIVCNATLRADVPSNFGSAEEEISYRIEKMEDGGLHIELEGLE